MIKEPDIPQIIKDRKLLNAIDSLHQKLESSGYVTLQEELKNTEELYRQLTHYVAEGIQDNEREHVILYLQKKLLSIFDEIRMKQGCKESSDLYYQKQNIRTSIGGVSLEETIKDLLEPNLEQSNRNLYDRLVEQVFESVWTVPSLSEQDAFLLSSLPERVRLSVASAIALSFPYRWDWGKVRFILSEWMEPSISANYKVRLGWALLQAFHLHSSRIDLYHEELSTMLDQANNVHPLQEVLRPLLLRYSLALYFPQVAQEISTKSTSIAQQMRDRYELLSQHANGESSTENELKNLLSDPRFQEIDEEMQRLSQMEEEGLDMMFAYFRNLKNYPFFNDLSHWFVPFDLKHSVLEHIGEETKSKIRPILPLFELRVCDSDLYSLLLSWVNVPMLNNHQFFEQTMQMIQEAGLSEQESFSSSTLRLDFAAKRYIENLFRFHELFQFSGNGLANPFEDESFLTRLSLLTPYLLSGNTLQSLGYSFSKYGFHKRATGIFELLAQYNGDEDASIYSSLGYSLIMEEKYQEAANKLQMADLIGGSDELVLKRLAFCYRKSLQPEKAIGIYQQLLNTTNDSSVVQNLTALYIEQGKHRQAIELLEKYSNLLNQQQRNPHKLLAWIYFLDRKPQKALQHALLAIEENMTSASATDYLNLGHIYLLLGQSKEAVQSYQRSIALSSSEVWNKKMEEDETDLQKVGVDHTLLEIVKDAVRMEERDKSL